MTTPPPQTGSTKLVIAAVAIALVAVVLTNVYIEIIRRDVREQSFKVYVLTRTVQPGDVLRSNDVEEQLVPERFRQSLSRLQVMTDSELQTRINQRDAVLRVGRTGDPVTHTLFRTPGLDTRASDVESGKRLISLPVNSATLPGIIQQGMFVDIEAPFNTGGSQPQVLPIMEQVQIVALGAQTFTDSPDGGGNRAPRSFRTITIEVTPDEATEFAMIQNLATGPFNLQIRNPNDRGRPKLEREGLNQRVVALVDQATGRVPQATIPVPSRQ